ncbi:MAG: hypothetical protein PWQ96_280 [Clostridia bacterium]|jgi:uncharacterized membrane protein|nr:hypothetical protein [Clostridia bacterium]
MLARFPIGMIALIVVAVLIYFGLAQRVLDRMRLSDKAALAIIGALVVGSFINIPITRGTVDTSINVGGAIVPIIVAIYVLTKAGTGKEWIRAILATIAVAASIFVVNRYLLPGDPWQTGADFLDPLYIYPIMAGVIAYLIGRSRRSAFIAATLGVLALDIVDYLYLTGGEIPGNVAIGGAGVFDVIVLSGIISVLLAELLGETRERLQGGPESEGRPKELVEGLTDLKLGAKPAKKPIEGGEGYMENENSPEGKEGEKNG